MVMCEDGQGRRSLLRGNAVGMVVRQGIKVRVKRYARRWFGSGGLRFSSRISAAVAGVTHSEAVDLECRGRGMRDSSSSVRLRLMLRATRRLLRGKLASERGVPERSDSLR